MRRPLLRGADAERALRAATHVFSAAVALHEKKPFAPPGTLDGYGALVLLADALARAGASPRPDLETLLPRALVFRADELSLYAGAAGLLVVLDAVDPRRETLEKPRAHLREALAGSLRAPEPPDLERFSSYDLIYGVAGRALALGDVVPEVIPAIRAWTERYVAEAERCTGSPEPETAAIYLGVAHGAGGVLAMLNAVVPRPDPLVRRLVDLVLRLSHDADGARRWDSVWNANAVPRARRAWCYGTLGVATVLYDRALLDGDDALRALAVRAVDALLDDDRDDLPQFVPSLCHGRAGVAALAWHLAGEGEGFVRHAERIAAGVLAEYDPNQPFGFAAVDVGDGRGTERADFLDAALGIALFLVDAATADERRWLPLLGIRPD